MSYLKKHMMAAIVTAIVAIVVVLGAGAAYAAGLVQVDAPTTGVVTVDKAKPVNALEVYDTKEAEKLLGRIRLLVGVFEKPQPEVQVALNPSNVFLKNAFQDDVTLRSPCGLQIPGRVMSDSTPGGQGYTIGEVSEASLQDFLKTKAGSPPTPIPGQETTIGYLFADIYSLEGERIGSACQRPILASGQLYQVRLGAYIYYPPQSLEEGKVEMGKIFSSFAVTD